MKNKTNCLNKKDPPPVGEIKAPASNRGDAAGRCAVQCRLCDPTGQGGNVKRPRTDTHERKRVNVCQTSEMKKVR